MNIKIWATGIIAFFVIFAVTLSSDHLQVAYTIKGKGIVFPYQEWTLTKTLDGNLVISLKNNFTNSFSDFSIAEFQRGDMARFQLRPEILSQTHVLQGDTIGAIISNAENRRLIELQGELQVQNKLLEFHASGQKPQEIQAAHQRMVRAQQEYETQKRITERNRSLYEQEYISEEEYELSMNTYQVKFHNYHIAQSEYEAVISGSKSEQLEYVNAQIQAIEEQIYHLQNLISDFTITTPITGQLVRQRTPNGHQDAIIKIIDASQYLVSIPVDIYQLNYINPGDPIELIHPGTKEILFGEIIGFDNNIQMFGTRQKVFVNARLIPGHSAILSNMQVDLKIQSGQISIMQHLNRFFIDIYNN